MIKLLYQTKPTRLRAGDRVIFRKADATLTIMRGSEHVRFQTIGGPNGRGDNKVLLGAVEDPQTFFTGLVSIMSGISGLDAQGVQMGDAYLSFVFVDPKGDV